MMNVIVWKGQTEFYVLCVCIYVCQAITNQRNLVPNWMVVKINYRLVMVLVVYLVVVVVGVSTWIECMSTSSCQIVSRLQIVLYLCPPVCVYCTFSLCGD